MFSLTGKSCVAISASCGLGRARAVVAPTAPASDEAEWVSGAALLVSGGAVVTSDPSCYLVRVNGGP